MPDLQSRFDTLVGQLPVSWVAWGYNLRRSLRLLWPSSPYPLADRADALSCQPLIFLSSGRAGTTLLRSMLVVNGQIAIPPESFALAFTALQYQAMQEQSWYNLVRLVISLFEGIEMFHEWEVDLHPVYVQARALAPQERSLARIIDLVFMHYARVHYPNANLWGDQSPYNTRRLRWIMAVFPQARYLHILRDGRDVVASYKAKGSARETVDWAIDRWSVAVRTARQAQKRLPDEGFLEIRYEDLVRDSEATLQRVCQFAGIDYNANMLDYWKSPTTIEAKHHTYHQNLTRPVFTDSIGRWRERLSEAEQAHVSQQLAPLLHDLGYRD